MKKARDLIRKTPRASFSAFPKPFSSSSTNQIQMDPSERYCYNPVLRWNPKVEEYFVKAYGADHFARISRALTRPSCYSCIRVNILKTTTEAVIKKLTKIIQDSSSEISAEGIKLTEISKCDIPGLDYVLFVKGSGPHVIDYGYTPDQPPKEVLVSRKCAEAVLRGAKVYVPGVLACSAHVETGDVVAVSVSVEQPSGDGGWSAGMTRGTILQGLPSDPFYFERKGLYIGQGKTMMSRAGMFRALKGVAVNLTNQVFKLPSLHDVLEGEVFLQNLPSIIAAHALDPKEGERILDMCAAPGGKTTAIALLMKDEGEIVAADRSHNKVLDVKNLAAEMGLKSISTHKLDACKAVRRSRCDETSLVHNGITNGGGISTQSSDLLIVSGEEALSGSAERLEATTTFRNDKAIETSSASKAEIRKYNRMMKNGTGRNQCLGGRVENSKGFSSGSFDRVLLDAPCSALGLRPRLFAGEVTIESLRTHVRYQRNMFDQAVQLVRPGGVLVYSTCTINPGENEALVRYALDKYKFLSLSPQHPRIGGPGLVGQCEFPDGYVEEWLRPGEEELVQRFDPSSSLDTIGFFIAKFIVGLKE